MKENERTFQMRKNFISLREKGLSISDIAKEFHLSDQTVYNNLSKIAEENGCKREDLLDIVRPKYLTYDRMYQPVKPINFDEFRRSTKSALAVLEEICSQIEEEYEKAR